MLLFCESFGRFRPHFGGQINSLIQCMTVHLSLNYKGIRSHKSKSTTVNGQLNGFPRKTKTETPTSGATLRAPANGRIFLVVLLAAACVN